MSLCIAQALKNASSTLKEASLKYQFALREHLESELLLAFVLQQPRVYLHTHGTDILDDETFKRFEHCIALRAQGTPIEYITNQVSFYGRDFFVNPHTLIPRPETEILIDVASEIITSHHLTQIVEIGTGSGIISTTLAIKCPESHFIATDINTEILKVAHKNISYYHLGDRITLLQNNILRDPFPQPCEILISNPPYIKDRYPISKPLTYEPPHALFGGEDGLDILLALINVAAQNHLWLVCEIGYDQKAILSEILEKHQAQNIMFYKDLSGWDRGFSAYFH